MVLHISVALEAGTRHLDVTGPNGIPSAAMARLLHAWDMPDLYLGATPLPAVGTLPAAGAILLTPYPLRAGGGPPEHAGTWLVADEGPDAGPHLAAVRGTHEIGRGPGNLQVLDPAMSRLHAECIVDGTSLRIVEVSPGRDTPRPDGTPLRAGESVMLGSTVFRLRHLAPARLPRPPWPPAPATIAGPKAMSRPWLALLAAAAPLGIGIALALATGSWFFLAFSALGLATGGPPAIADLVRRRRCRAAIHAASVREAVLRSETAPAPGAIALSSRVPPRVAEGCPRDSVPLRLGTGRFSPTVSWTGGGPPGRGVARFRGPVLETLAPDTVGTVTGTSRAAAALFRALALQLWDQAHPTGPHVVAAGQVPVLPAELRCVPGTHLAPTPDALAGILRSVRARLVVIVATALPPAWDDALRQGTGDGPAPALLLLDPQATVGATWSVDADHGVLLTGGSESVLVPDGVSWRTLTETGERWATTRALPGMQPALPPGTLPDGARLPLPEAAWTDDASRSLVTAWGLAESGPLEIDLVADGPHVLVAGTTGSGKSELIRSIVQGLACRYAPAEVAFLLVDFKGGATLGDCADLPHATTLATDLDAAGAARTLALLRSELSHRERALRTAGAPDYAGWRDAGGSSDTPMPRLVVVVDEFRVLVDEVPQGLAELARLAAVGRSLGVHLILSTQRPQGTVPSELRANLNAVVALRLKSELESQELVGTPAAARLPRDRPGRALLRLGSDAPVAFQAYGRPGRVPEWTVTESGPGLGSVRRRQSIGGEDPAAPMPELVRSIAPRQAGRRGRAFPPPLPTTLREVPVGGDGADAGPPAWGLVDDIDGLRHRPLSLSASTDPRYAVVSGPAGGGLEGVAALVGSVARSATEHAIYVLDGTGRLRDLRAVPRVVGMADPTEPERAAEVLDATARRPVGIRTLLVVTGIAQWQAALGATQWAAVEDRLLAQARTTGPAPLAIVAVGDRDLMSSRYFALAAHRIYCPFGLGEETTMAWPRLLAVTPAPGRGLLVVPGGPTEGRAVQLLRGLPAPAAGAPFPAAPAGASRCLPLPDRIESSALQQGPPAGRGARDGWTIGLAAPDNAPYRWRPEGIGLVIGAPGTGKSSLLRLLHAIDAGPSLLLDADSLGAAGNGAPAAVFIDDGDRLTPDGLGRIEEWTRRGSLVVVAMTVTARAAFAPPLAAAARRRGSALLLGPTGPSDGDALGWRLEVRQPAPPGRAVALGPGGPVRIQLAYRPPGP